jgi:Ser/Thr protein kinase RdoA (MazF antagonist)
VRGKPAAIVAFLPGLSVRRPEAKHCRQAGEGLARLHLAAQGYPGRRVNALGQPSWAAMFEGLTGAAEDLKPGLAATITDDLAHLAKAWPNDLPKGTIHADLFPDNVFFKGDQFAAAIDFYFACDDALAYDLAICLNAWCFEADGAFNVTAGRALVSGYEHIRPLSPQERQALPVLAWGAAIPWLARRGWTSQVLMQRLMPISLLVLLAIALGGPLYGASAAWMWTGYCVCASVVTLSQPAVGLAFPAHLAGRALSAFNLVIFSGVFTVQWGLGLVIDALLHLGWSLPGAYQGAVAVSGMCSLGAYGYFLLAKKS